MPTRPPRICPHCQRPVPAGQRCSCRPTLDTRASAHRRGYGTDWRKLRAELMPPGTRCVRCGAPAKHLDHITPKRLGGSDDPSNLQPLCAHCHNSTKQAEEKRGGRVWGVDAQGRPLDPDHPWNREGTR